MRPGFAALLSRMNWVEKIGLLDDAPFKGDTLVPLPLVTTTHVPGFRCAGCQIVTLDYGRAD